MNIFSLECKNVVLTGASGFMGRHFARGLLDAGARMILVDNSDRVGAQTSDFNKEFGDGRATCNIVDQYDHDEVATCFSRILDQHGKIDVLINNAFDFSVRTGFNDDSGRIENATFAQLSTSLESGLYWAIQATQIFGAAMTRARSGSVINICSMYSIVTPDPKLYEGTSYFNPPGYSAAKASLLAFTRYAAAFYGPHVRVNAILPGAFSNTEDDSYNAVAQDDEFLGRLADRTLLRRIGHPRDLIGALILLASDASSYMTGHGLTVDGGWTVT